MSCSSVRLVYLGMSELHGIMRSMSLCLRENGGNFDPSMISTDEIVKIVCDLGFQCKYLYVEDDVASTLNPKVEV